MKTLNRFLIILFLLITSTLWADLNDGLLAHYKFDETSGVVFDETGNYDGTNYEQPEE